MLSPAENNELCKVGPGTLMGDLIRQYWLPALSSDELARSDSEPLRLMLLGEQLIAFRDTLGRVGVIANNCPHRGASLFFGRNEEEGLRCVYHGWKFDISGACVDMPNEPAESDFRTKVKATAYPTQERGGVVWVYMGPRSDPPPLPLFEGNPESAGDTSVWMGMRACNWVQALEGDIDTSHLGFLHLGSVAAGLAEPDTFSEYMLRDRAPRFAVVDTEYGVLSGAYRAAQTDTYYWRLAHFLFPFYTMPPVGVLGTPKGVRAWVPMDDHHTIFITMSPKQATPGGRSMQSVPGASFAFAERIPNGTGWFDRFRLTAKSDNDYQIDRATQRDGSFSGITGIHLQDQAVTESMGPVFDRSSEHLGSTDAFVIRTRRRLLAAARNLRESGGAPPALDAPDAYLVRAGGVVLPREADWVESTRHLVDARQQNAVDLSVAGNIPGA